MDREEEVSVVPSLTLDDLADQIRAVDGVALANLERRHLAVVGRGDDHFLASMLEPGSLFDKSVLSYVTEV